MAVLLLEPIQTSRLHSHWIYLRLFHSCNLETQLQYTSTTISIIQKLLLSLEAITPDTLRMPIRNPFARRPDVHNGFDPINENGTQNGPKPTFEKVDTMGSKSSAMSIKSGNSHEPAEYKMSGMRQTQTWRNSAFTD